MALRRRRESEGGVSEPADCSLNFVLLTVKVKALQGIEKQGKRREGRAYLFYLLYLYCEY